jgi:hypothetical protein
LKCKEQSYVCPACSERIKGENIPQHFLNHEKNENINKNKPQNPLNFDIPTLFESVNNMMNDTNNNNNNNNIFRDAKSKASSPAPLVKEKYKEEKKNPVKKNSEVYKNNNSSECNVCPICNETIFGKYDELQIHLLTSHPEIMD